LGGALGLAVGALRGLGSLPRRRHVPESPRWLVTHGWRDQAEATTADIEARVRASAREPLAPVHARLTLHPRRTFGFALIFRAMLGKYRARSALALVLMVAQAFLFNAVFFSYGLVLAQYHDVPDTSIGLYLLPLAASNFLGPLLLGHFFDTIGRRVMIAGTYAVSAVLLVVTALIFGFDGFTAWTQTVAWMLIFFFASAAASAAYLTASEIFPLETRALAIATFYALGTAIGGSTAPTLFGYLIGTGSVWALSGGYGVAAVLMAAAALAEAKFGVDA